MSSAGNVTASVVAVPQCSAVAASLAYEEPTLPVILTLAAFLVLLNVLHDIVDRILHAGIVAQLILGAVFGAPLANILPDAVQRAVQAIGFLGLLLLIVQGGMSTRLDILAAPKTLALAVATGTTGIVAPIGLSMILLPFAYRFTYLEIFVVGASLSSTSLGTTLAVIAATSSESQSHAASSDQNKSNEQLALDETTDGASVLPEHQSNVQPPPSRGILDTRIGTILIGAALLDDIVALVLSGVIASLGDTTTSDLRAWPLARPIVSSVLLIVGTIVVARFAFKPAAPLLSRLLRYVTDLRIVRRLDDIGPQTGILLWLAVVCAFISIADRIDSTTLIGAFCAGAFTVYVHRALQSASSTAIAHSIDPWRAYDALRVVQDRLLSPFFFASIGFAIPVRDMFDGMTVWKGALFAGLMALAKVVACLPVLVAGLCSGRVRCASAPASPTRSRAWPPALFLGFALVARGEIGFLIINIARQAGILSCQAASPTALTAFNVGVWAITLNTLVGPAALGLFLRADGILNEIQRGGAWGSVSR